MLCMQLVEMAIQDTPTHPGVQLLIAERLSARLLILLHSQIAFSDCVCMYVCMYVCMSVTL